MSDDPYRIVNLGDVTEESDLSNSDDLLSDLSQLSD